MKNTIAELPKDGASDEMSIEGVVESLITLEATATIQNVVKLYEKLKNSYAAYNTIEIDASSVSSIDTATLQLLIALKKDAIKEQKQVVFAAPSQRFIEAAELLGLLEILNVDA
jgi:anti-anti-sigma regulatory factor